METVEAVLDAVRKVLNVVLKVLEVVNCVRCVLRVLGVMLCAVPCASLYAVLYSGGREGRTPFA